MTPAQKERFDREISAHPIVLYMKGNALFPRCGFSAQTLEVLKAHGQVHTVDVLAEPELRDAIKAYSGWPTIPQVFIHGKFVGGCDIVRELEERGELQAMISGKGASGA
jgi:monothiol glutaredoxin